MPLPRTLPNPTVVAKLRKVKFLALDFDGVMTDGTFSVDQRGVESVRCSRRDGLGVSLLRRHGIRMLVITAESNPVAAVRCKKLGLPCHVARDGAGKLAILKRAARKLGMTAQQVAFIGDDLNDVAPLTYAGVALTVADAHPAVRRRADYVARAIGGQHAFREIVELILRAQDAAPVAY